MLTPTPRTRLVRTVALAALGVGAGWVVTATGQAARPAALSAALRAHVQAEQFQAVTGLRGLPLGVREGLGTLFGTRTLDIVEPDAPFQASGVVGDARLPIRRFVTAGCSYEHCLVYYERGGRARAWRVALFYWTPDETRFEWGGAAPAGLASIDDLRRAVLSGAIKGPGEPW